MRWVLLGSASVLMACGGGNSAARPQGPGDASGSSSSGGGGGGDAWSDGDAGGGSGADGGAGGSGDAADAGSISQGDGSPEAGTPNGMWVMGYYSGWDSSLYPVGEIDWAGLSHLAVAFYLFDSQGTIDDSLSQGNAGQALGHSLVSAAHQAGKKAIASFGGAGSEAMWVGATSTANRATFEAHIRQVVGTYGYDGVDLDWEPFAAADHAALLALAQELRAAAPSYLTPTSL
jgi:hypothetical protein